MALPRLEPFTAADGELRTQIAGWEYLPNLGGYATPSIVVESNKVRHRSAAVAVFAVDTLNTYNNDQYAQIVYHNSTSSAYIGVAVRCDLADLGGVSSGAHKQCYYFECAGGDRFFSKKVAGIDTQLGDDGGTPADGDVLRIEAQGTTIRALINGATIFSVTDATFSSGSAGVMGEGDAAGAFGDDWEGGNLAAGTTLTPAAGALSLAGKVMTLAVAAALSASSVVFAGRVPTVTVNSGTTISPAVGVVTLAGQIPTSHLDQGIAVPAGALVLAGNVPNIGGNISLTPAAGVLTLTGLAPSPVTTGSIGVPAGSLVLSSQAASLGVGIGVPPGLLRLDGQYPYFAFLDPTPGVLTFTGNVPALAISGLYQPAAGALALVGQVPALQSAIAIAVPTGALTYAGQIPTPVFTGSISPAAGVLTLVGQVPALRFTFVLPIPAGSVVLGGQTPTVNSGLTIAVPVGALVLAGQVTSLSSTLAVTPSVGALAFVGAVPSLRYDVVIAPASGAVVLAGQIPAAVGNGAVSPSQGLLVLAGQAPSLFFDVRPLASAGSVVLAGQVPGLRFDLVIGIPAGALTFAGSVPNAPRPAFLTDLFVVEASPVYYFSVKDPDATNWPRGFDWTDYLAGISPAETLESSIWTYRGKDALLEISEDSIVTGGLKTQLQLTAGTIGKKYKVTNSIVTSSGVHDDRSFIVLIQNE